MNKVLLKRIVYGIGILLTVWFLLVQNGGDTITILNHRQKEICEVYFAFNPEENGWGPNRLGSVIRYTHSRDIRLPLYFEWLAENPEVGYHGRAVSCEGEVLAEISGLGVDANFQIWTISLMNSETD